MFFEGSGLLGAKGSHCFLEVSTYFISGNEAACLRLDAACQS